MEVGSFPPVTLPSLIPLSPGSESELEETPALPGEREESAEQNRLDSKNALNHLPLLALGFQPVETTKTGADPRACAEQPASPATVSPGLSISEDALLASVTTAIGLLGPGRTQTKSTGATNAPAQQPAALPQSVNVNPVVIGDSDLEPPDPATVTRGAVEDDGPSGLPRSTESRDGSAGGLAGQELTEQEQREVQELKTRDREVRQHEQAHMAAAGGHARGGPSYEYTTGPDNRRYAIGGEVSIDTS